MLSNKPKIEYVVVTPELARKWLDEQMFERQRDVRPGAVKQYAEMMAKGEWQDWSILLFAQNGLGRSVGIDGQHRLLAVEASGNPMRTIVITYPTQNYAEIVDRYIHTDKGRNRTSLDTIVALGLSEKYDAPKSLLNKAWSAVNVIAGNFEVALGNKKGIRLESTAIRLLEEEGYAEIAKIYSELVGTAYHAGFYRRGTMAVALYTLKYAPEKIEEKQVHEFWYQASHGIGEDPDDPRRKLHDFIENQPMFASHKKNKQEVVSPTYAIYLTAKCWNAYLGNQLIKRGRVATNKDLVIEATPLGKELKVELPQG